MKALDRLGKSVKHFTDKNDPVILVKETNYFSFTFFIIGALAGAIAGLLFTPDSGEKNRTKLAEKLKEIQKDDVKFSGRKSYKVREISDEGIKNLEQERENLTML